MPIKKRVSLENQYKYHSVMQNSHFKKCCDIADKIAVERKIRAACQAQNLFFNGKVDVIDMYAEFQKNLNVYREP